ncbi:MAG: magnesium/cobalt transporter CorA [Microscillaceae bacterium]|nr:magnesium/cobalt transporter CorA [Microscillaceae bacterium]
MIELIQFNADTQKKINIAEESKIKTYLKRSLVSWIDLKNLPFQENLEHLAQEFEIHHLTLEDVKNEDKLPQAKTLDEHIFLTLKVLSLDQQKAEIHTEQVSLILKKDIIMTFQQCEEDIFEEIKARIVQGKGRVRQKKADYLFYLMIDTILKKYFKVLEIIDQQIEELEERILVRRTKNITAKVLKWRRLLSQIKKYITPLREELGELRRESSPFIKKDNLIYIQDNYDNLMHLLSQCESHREMLNNIQELYLSNLSYGLNNIMKTLTMITAIFIPSTFIAGVYGMNFKYMPELNWPWSYPIILGFMFTLATSLFLYMRFKKWF